MTDGHIHIEYGDYTLDWIQEIDVDKTYRDYNVKIITSSDAHHPEDVGYKIRELNECVKNV